MDIANSLHLDLWIKIATLIIMVFYIVFTLVVFTQVKAMSQIVRIPQTEQVIKTVAIIHIVLAISLFLFALVIL